jgi:hypothetical protein
LTIRRSLDVEPPTERPVILTPRDARVLNDLCDFALRMNDLLLEASIIGRPLGHGEIERVQRNLKDQL